MSDENDVLDEEEKDEDEVMDVVHASETEVVAKPKNVKKMADKAIAKKLTPEEERKNIEDNILGEFWD